MPSSKLDVVDSLCGHILPGAAELHRNGLDGYQSSVRSISTLPFFNRRSL